MISVNELNDSVLYLTDELYDFPESQRTLQYEASYKELPEGMVEVEDLFPDEIYSVAGFEITLVRSVFSPIMNTFLPSLLIVFTSFIR